MASKEDLAYFREQQQKVPENKVCFECKATNPQWCDVWHGIYICLECSGVHRSLGTHISFVRSLSMDTWPEDKMKLMRCGGNHKALAFFRSHGIKDDMPIREKYATDAAAMYKDKLSAEANGLPFRESDWKPPERKASNTQTYANARPEPGFGGSRYQGIQSPTTNTKAQTDVLGDAGAALTKSLASWGATISEAASAAAVKSKELASTASAAAASQNYGEKMKALTEKSKQGWGSLTTWTKTLTAGMTSGAGGGDDDNPFGEVLANVGAKKSTFQGISSDQMLRQQQQSSSSSSSSPGRDAPSSSSVDMAGRNSAGRAGSISTTPPPNGGSLGSSPMPGRSPMSDGARITSPRSPNSQQQSPQNQEEWGWNENDDGWGDKGGRRSPTSTNSSGPTGSVKRGFGSGSKGASLSSMRKVTKKAD